MAAIVAQRTVPLIILAEADAFLIYVLLSRKRLQLLSACCPEQIRYSDTLLTCLATLNTDVFE